MFNKIKEIQKTFVQWLEDHSPFFKSLRSGVKEVVDTWNENWKKAREDQAVQFYNFQREEIEKKIKARDSVQNLDEFLQLTGANDFQNILNNNTNILDSGAPAQVLQPAENNLDQQNTFNIEIKIDGSNPEMTPEKIGEEVKKGTQAAIDKLLRETSQSFPFTEPRFA